MGAIHVPEPKPYHGYFRWPKVHEDIKNSIPDYDINDPRTWPLISLDQVKDHLRCQSWPPHGVAYSKEAMETILIAKPTLKEHMKCRMKISLNQNSYWQGFRYYPFNYASDGSLRLRVGIPKAEYDLWKSYETPPTTMQRKRKEAATVNMPRTEDTPRTEHTPRIEDTPRIEHTPRTETTPSAKDTPGT